MTSNLRIIVFAVCAFLWLGEISSSKAGPDKDPFHELVRLTASENNDTMSTRALESLLNTLGERIKKLKDCFSLDKLRHLVPPEEDISDSGFANISDTLIDFIMMTNCSDISKDATANPHVDDIIKGLHKIEYESKDGIEKCFNAFSLRESSGNPSQLHATIILYLYEGQCILPDRSYFLTEYRGYFKNENGVATKEVFENFISELGIGGDDAHDDHSDHDDHSGEEHDHGTHDDDESEHEHHDNDDHNSGVHDHDDDHSDDGDNHDDHSEGDHDHDEDHGDAGNDHDDHSEGGHDHDEDHGDDGHDHDDHSEGGHDHDEDHGDHDDHSEGRHDHDEDHGDDGHDHDDHSEGGHDHAEDHGDDYSEVGHDHDEDHGDHDEHSEGGHDHDDDHGDGGDDHSEVGHDHDEDHGDHDEHSEGDHDHDDDHRDGGDDHSEGGHDHDEDNDDDHSEGGDAHDENHDDDHDNSTEGHGHGDGGSNPRQDELSRKRRDAHEEHDAEHPKERCFSAEQLLDIFGIDGEITEEREVELCPALVQQLTSGACKAREHDDHGSSAPDGYTEAMVYGYGTASVAIISFLALLGFAVFPVLKTESYKFVMQFFIGLGVGTMAADAIIHIIPHVLGVHKHDTNSAHGHEEEGDEEDLTYIWKMSVVAGGVYIFFFFENCLRLWKRNCTENPKTTRAHEVYANTPRLGDSSEKTDSENAITSFSNISGNNDTKYNAESTSIEKTSEEMLEKRITVCGRFTTTLITVFVGDILHNFADGVAIGVSFTNSWATGIGTSIAILCHELPHEIGDFAIYLKNGASKWQAVGLNFGAACCAFIGLYTGIGMGRDEVVRTWMMAAVAGMFLYIALVQVMNEMVREQTTNPLLQFIVQNLGLVLGWAILVVIALYEEKLQTIIG